MIQRLPSKAVRLAIYILKFLARKRPPFFVHRIPPGNFRQIDDFNYGSTLVNLRKSLIDQPVVIVYLFYLYGDASGAAHSRIA